MGVPIIIRFAVFWGLSWVPLFFGGKNISLISIHVFVFVAIVLIASIVTSVTIILLFSRITIITYITIVPLLLYIMLGRVERKCRTRR